MTRIGRRSLALCVVALTFRTPADAQQPVPTERASIRGVATDSLRGGPLTGAYIAIMPGGKQVPTNADGSYRVDGVQPGVPQRLVVMHAMLDTLGITLTSPEFTLRPSEIRIIDLSVPTGASLVREFCGEAARARGPTAMIGFVRDPDTGVPVDSVTVSLVYDLSPVKTVPLPVVRTARPDSTGRYLICGLPARVRGTVQLVRGGVTSSAIPFAVDTLSPLVIRAFGLSRTTRVATVAAPDTTTPPVQVLRGDATLTGRIVDKSGKPLPSAHVQMERTLAAAITGADGRFALDSIPIGTQVVSIRKVGYAFTERVVDISRTKPAAMVVTMSDAPTLNAVVVSEERRVKDLEAVGFTRRRERGFGFFIEGEQIDKAPEALGEALRMIPGIHVGYDASNKREQKTVIMPSRDNGGCINYIVDGMVWQNAAGADIEQFIRPAEIEALEAYSATTVPAEFIVAGKGKCSVLVIWTKLRIHDAAKRP